MFLFLFFRPPRRREEKNELINWAAAFYREGDEVKEALKESKKEGKEKKEMSKFDRTERSDLVCLCMYVLIQSPSSHNCQKTRNGAFNLISTIIPVKIMTESHVPSIPRNPYTQQFPKKKKKSLGRGPRLSSSTDGPPHSYEWHLPRASSGRHPPRLGPPSSPTRARNPLLVDPRKSAGRCPLSSPGRWRHR